jgi:RNA polymerase primary sigma factor
MRQLKITQQITSRETISMTKYLQEIGTFPLLTLDEEQTLPAKIQAGDARALKRFIEGNLRFVISVAKQHISSSPGEKFDDLVGAGNVGLLKAAHRFDVTRGFKFISYAVWWVRQSIMEHVNENSKHIRLPLNKTTIINKVKRATSTLEQRLQRHPSAYEIAEYMNELALEKESKEPEQTQESIEEILAIGGSYFSLDVPIGEEGDNTTLHDIIPGQSEYDVNQTMKQKDLQDTLLKVMKKKLSPREQDIIGYFFGAFGKEQRTLDEISEKMDLTRERVRQIKEQALRKMKFNSAREELKEYL